VLPVKLAVLPLLHRPSTPALVFPFFAIWSQSSLFAAVPCTALSSLSTFLLLALPLLLACLLAASSTLQSPLPFHHHGPSTAAPASFALPASPAVLTTAIDDMSLGFMQRVVHLCLS
jgi:hypothetical protein